MDKKLIAPIILVVLVGFVVFVSANSMIGGNDFPYIVEVDVLEGWNIIAGILPSEAILSDSEIKASDIKAVWYYAPTLKKYLQIYPNPDDLLGTVDDDIVLTSAMWVYSDKEGILKYSTIEDYPPLEDRQLFSGFNFFTITSDIEGKTPEKIKGNCNIEKIFGYDPSINNWVIFPLDEDFYKDTIGLGLVIKVPSNCKLGEVSDTITPPPALP